MYPPFSLFSAIFSASEIISWRVANLILSLQEIERWRGYNIFNKRHLSQCYASPTSYHVFPRMFALSFRLSDRKYWIELDYKMQSSYFRVQNATWAPWSIQSRWFTNVRASPRDQPHLESTRVRPSRNATVISYAGINLSWGRKSWIACFCRYVYYLSQPNPAVFVTPTTYAKMPQARISTSSSNWMNTFLLWFCLRVIQLG